MSLCFIDTETTGLDETEHEIIEVAAILDCGSYFDTKIRPEHIETASPRALEVNGYFEEAWANALSLTEAMEQLAEHVSGCAMKRWLPAGQNVGFDIRFLRAAYKQIGMTYPFHYHHVDTMTLAYEHLKPLGQGSISLDALCTTLGVPNDGAHTALADARRAMEVYHRLCRATWWDRLKWKRRIEKLNREEEHRYER